MQSVDGRGLKKAVSIELTAFLAFFVFCSEAVPSYSSHSQENEIHNLSQQSFKNILSDILLDFDFVKDCTNDNEYDCRADCLNAGERNRCDCCWE